jgi:hypothetical protein
MHNYVDKYSNLMACGQQTAVAGSFALYLVLCAFCHRSSPTALRPCCCMPCTVGGTINFQPDSMPVQSAAWQQLSTVNGCQLIPWTIASHVCSYPCFFSQFGPKGAREQHGRCKLRGGWGDNRRGDDPAYCVGFPKHDPEFPLMQPPSKLVYGGR